MLYGGNNNWFASYAYWYFKLYGHEDVKLLDGGRKKWELDSRELVDRGRRARRRRRTRRRSRTRSIRAFRDEVEAAIGQKNLVDVRCPDEYAGKLLAPAHLPQEQSQRPGHIPTAANIPWSQAANDDGTFKSDDELTALYAGKGVDLAKDTIAYCRIGERSAHTWFVLHELLGQPNVKNYDGSWTEWGSLVGVPDRELGRPRALMCGATTGGLSTEGIDVTDEAVVQGIVTRDGEPVGGGLRAAARRRAASSPPRCRRRRPGSSGSSRRRAPGRCARWRRARAGRPHGRRPAAVRSPRSRCRSV